VEVNRENNVIADLASSAARSRPKPKKANLNPINPTVVNSRSVRSHLKGNVSHKVIVRLEKNVRHADLDLPANQGLREITLHKAVINQETPSKRSAAAMIAVAAEDRVISVTDHPAKTIKIHRHNSHDLVESFPHYRTRSALEQLRI
jgi:hypothetical protein